MIFNPHMGNRTAGTMLSCFQNAVRAALAVINDQAGPDDVLNPDVLTSTRRRGRRAARL